MNAQLAFDDRFRLVHGADVWTGPLLRGLAEAWAAGLSSSGLAAREPVALLCENEPRFVQALLAVRRAGAAFVPLHPRWTPVEIGDVVRRSGARLVWASAELRERVPPRDGVVVAPLPGAQDAFGLPRLTGGPRPLPTSYLLYTSGTEGRPRGVLLDEAHFQAHTLACRSRLGAGPDDRWLAALPFAHVGGLAMLLRALQLGSTLVLPTGSEPRHLGETVHSRRITHVSIVPALLRRWLEEPAPPRPAADLKLVLVGGAPAPPDLMARAHAAGLPVRATYGLTETCSQAATATAETPLGSSGPPLEGVRVRVVDGEIQVSGPTVMAGYHDDPELTKKMLVEGWLRTGDLGAIDPGGNLWVTGRRSRRIISGGENVDPAEVEAALEAHPAVLEAAVVGVEDPKWGQAVAALVVVRGGSWTSAEDLRVHCLSRLAPFKCPRRIEFVPSLPRTPSGKVFLPDVAARLTSA